MSESLRAERAGDVVTVDGRLLYTFSIVAAASAAFEFWLLISDAGIEERYVCYCYTYQLKLNKGTYNIICRLEMARAHCWLTAGWTSYISM